MKLREQREYKRIFASLPLHCTILPQRIKKFDTVSKDFGLGGIQFLSRSFMSQGKHLKISVSLINLVAEFNAQVVWCIKKAHTEGYYIGIKFLELSRMNQNNLNHFLSIK